MPSHRQQRVRELLKREIGEAIRRQVPIHQAGVITVNHVLISADLRQARVLLGFFGNSEQQKSAFRILEAQKFRIQDIVAKSVVLKFTPKLIFEMDDSVEQGDRILQILDSIEKQSPQGE